MDGFLSECHLLTPAPSLAQSTESAELSCSFMCLSLLTSAPPFRHNLKIKGWTNQAYLHSCLCPQSGVVCSLVAIHTGWRVSRNFLYKHISSSAKLLARFRAAPSNSSLPMNWKPSRWITWTVPSSHWSRSILSSSSTTWQSHNSISKKNSVRDNISPTYSHEH